MTLSPRLLLVLLLCVSPTLADNWPGWRGPRGDGHSTEKDLPLTWSRDENVKWKVPLPADGNSTPAVWSDRIFLTQATGNGKTRSLLCLDRAGGKQLWKVDVAYNEKEPTHGTNPFCSASPATDGKQVYISHGSAGLYCYDFDGKEVWKKDVGKMEHIWGNAASPLLYDNLVVFWVGPGPNQVLLALDRKNGKTVWEHKEPGGMSGLGDQKEWIGSWSTPIISKVGQRDELILSMPKVVRSFEPKTGKELWNCAGLTNLVYTSPVCSLDGIVLAMSGYGGAGLAVRAGGSGDVTKQSRLWHHAPGNPQRIGSAVVVGKHAYLINEQGLGQCFDLETGKDLWKKERVSGTTWSSLVASGERLYILTQNGETVVLAARPEIKILARNKLNEMARASIAVSDGELFIRTYKHLWCIGKR